MKKLLSLVLALMMMLSCVTVFAEGESAGESAGETADAGSTTISLSDEEKSAEEIRVNTPWRFL